MPMKGNIRPKKTVHASVEKHPIQLQTVIPDFSKSMLPITTERTFTGASDSRAIEQSYVMNLEKQLHFYELEIKYLKEKLEEQEKAKKDVDVEKMITQISTLHQESENSSNILKNKLKEDEVLLQESKQEKTKLLLQVSDLESQILSLKERSQCREAEFESLTKDLDSEYEKQQTLHEKIESLSQKIETQDREIMQFQQENAEKSQVSENTEESAGPGGDSELKDKLINSLRLEITDLREKLTKAEFEIEKKTELEKKLQQNCGEFIRQKAELSQEIFELNQKIKHDEEIKRNSENSAKSQEIERLSLKNAELLISYTNQVEKAADLKKQLSEMEIKLKKKEFCCRTQKTHAKELGNLIKSLENTNSALRRDKTLLTENIGDLKSEIEMRDDKLTKMSEKLSKQVVLKQEPAINGQKLKELSDLANKLKELTHS